MTDNYKKFINKECEYYPCHVSSTEKGEGEESAAAQEEFNCLFCFCPLYALGEKCGGDFTYTQEGVKDCSGCMIPHSPHGYEHIMSKWQLLVELAGK